MNSVVYLVLSLSLSASIIAALLLVFRPLYRNRLSKSWQYYIWLVVVLRLLVPLAPEANLMDALFGTVRQWEPAISAQHSREYAPPDSYEPDEAGGETSTESPGPTVPGQSDALQPVPGAQPPLWQQFAESLWMLWFVPALVLFVRSVTNYNSFLRYIRAGREEIGDEAVMAAYQRACEGAGIRRPLPVYQNRLASSPMLVGVFRPSIILPKLDMDVDGMQLVLRHELEHHRRLDLLYKWLVQLAVCVHWFNPLVHLVSREIGKDCELSCDERVVAKMPAKEKVRYGDTLLASVKAGGTYGSVVASVALSEDGKNLMERLAAVIKSKPGTRSTKIIAAVCSIFLICCASFSGAYIGAAAADAHITPAAGPTGPEPYVSAQVSRSIQDHLDADRIEGWATQWAASWLDSWSREQADYWTNYWYDYGGQYPTGDWNNYAQDSWSNLHYEYEDGYLVGVGVKNFDSLDNYRRTETVTVNGKTCTVAFSAGYESYADDHKVMALVREILTDNTGGGWQGAGYYVLRTVHYNTDREALLRQLYETRAFVEFMELVEHCEGLGVIEELLYLAADDGESMYFIFLAEQLPPDFPGGEALARKAVEQGDIVMLGEMEPFLSSTLYHSLLNELLGLPDYS